MENDWVRFVVTPSSALFPIFQQVIKQSEGKDSVIVSVFNKERSEKLKTEIRDHYRITFEYQEDGVTGIEVYKQINS